MFPCNPYTPYRYESESKRWVIYGLNHSGRWSYLTETAEGATPREALRNSGYGDNYEYDNFHIHPYEGSVQLKAELESPDRVSRMTQSKL